MRIDALIPLLTFTQCKILRRAAVFVVAFRTYPEWTRGFAKLGFLNVARSTEIVEHGFDLQCDCRIVLVTRIARIIASIVDVVVMTFYAVLGDVVEMFECDW